MPPPMAQCGVLRLGEAERDASEVVVSADGEGEGVTKGVLPPLTPSPVQEPDMAVVTILARADAARAMEARTAAVGRPLPPLLPPPPRVGQARCG